MMAVHYLDEDDSNALYIGTGVAEAESQYHNLFYVFRSTEPALPVNEADNNLNSYQDF